jgi:hypothetical protein
MPLRQPSSGQGPWRFAEGVADAMELSKLSGEQPNVFGIRSIENFDGSFFMAF